MKKHTRSGMGRTERRKAKLKEAKRLEEQEIYKKKKEEEAEEQKRLEDKYLGDNSSNVLPSDESAGQQ